MGNNDTQAGIRFAVAEQFQSEIAPNLGIPLKTGQRLDLSGFSE